MQWYSMGKGKEHLKPSTMELLPRTVEQRTIPPQWQAHYQRLVDLHDSLLKRRQDLNQDALEEKPTFSTHMADAGTDEYDRDFALSILSSEQNAIYEIEHALERILNGTYGICEVTGKRIDAARLNALPWTRFALEAESGLEKERAIDSPRLAPNNRVAKGKVAPGREGRGNLP